MTDDSVEKENESSVHKPLTDTCQSETVSVSVSEIPQISLGDHEEGTLVDLGISITDSGVIMSSAPLDTSLEREFTAISDNLADQDPLPIASSSDACPPELALAAVECSISESKKAQYEKALLTGRDVSGDSRFQAWKNYKIKTCTQVNEQFILDYTLKHCLVTDLKLVETNNHMASFILQHDLLYRQCNARAHIL